MKPEVGKAIWTTLFSCASSSNTPEKRLCFRNMTNALFGCFPCEECSLHFDYLTKRIPVEFYTTSNCTNEDCLQYVVFLYNTIENLLEKEGKKKAKYLSWEDIKEKWLSECNRCKV